MFVGGNGGYVGARAPIYGVKGQDVKGLDGEDKKWRGSLGNGGALTRRFSSLGIGFDVANSFFFFEN